MRFLIGKILIFDMYTIDQLAELTYTNKQGNKVGFRIHKIGRLHKLLQFMSHAKDNSGTGNEPLEWNCTIFDQWRKDYNVSSDGTGIGKDIDIHPDTISSNVSLPHALVDEDTTNIKNQSQEEPTKVDSQSLSTIQEERLIKVTPKTSQKKTPPAVTTQSPLTAFGFHAPDSLMSPISSRAASFKKQNQAVLPMFHVTTGPGIGGIRRGSGTNSGGPTDGGVGGGCNGLGGAAGGAGTGGGGGCGGGNATHGSSRGGGIPSDFGGGGGVGGAFSGTGTPYNPFIAELEAWRKISHKTNQYIKLKRDEDWPRWLTKFQQRAKEDAFERVLDRAQHLHTCTLGASQELWKLQVNFLAMILEFCLETSIGQFYVTCLIDTSAFKVWFAVKDHYFTSTAALHASNDILTKLQNLNITTFTKRQDFLTNIQELLQCYDQLSPNDPMSVQLKINTFQIPSVRIRSSPIPGSITKKLKPFPIQANHL